MSEPLENDEHRAAQYCAPPRNWGLHVFVSPQVLPSSSYSQPKPSRTVDCSHLVRHSAALPVLQGVRAQEDMQA